MTMFGNNMFGGQQQQQNPYLDMQRLQQLQQINQVNNYQVVNEDKHATITKTIQNLSSDERDNLVKDENFMYYNQVYEQGLIAFIASQFRQQYNASPDGQKALTDLENSLNDTLKVVKAKVEDERTQMREIAELIKNNPDILKQINKTKTNKDGSK